MTSVTMQDRLCDAVSRLNLMLALFASNASLEDANGGLALLTGDVLTDVEGVLQAMRDEDAKPTA